jgi:hypothetical protein
MVFKGLYPNRETSRDGTCRTCDSNKKRNNNRKKKVSDAGYMLTQKRGEEEEEGLRRRVYGDTEASRRRVSQNAGCKSHRSGELRVVFRFLSRRETGPGLRTQGVWHRSGV